MTPHRAVRSRASSRRVFLALAWYELGHMEGIYRYAREADWTLGRWQAGQKGAVRAFTPHGVLCQLYTGVPALIREVAAAKVPVVALSTHVPQLRVPRVIPDYVAAGRLAAEHLLERGFRQFVYLGASGQLRYYGSGFTDAVSAAGCTCRDVCVDTPAITRLTGENYRTTMFVHDEFSKGRRRWARAFFAATPKPVGVFVTNEIWANDIVEACLDAGIHIPEEVAIVSSAESPGEGANLPVPLSTVLIDYEAQAYEAAAMLDCIMRGRAVPQDTVTLVPPKGIVARASTRVYVKDNLDVTRAVAFIMRRLHDPQLSVKAVVIHLGKPERTLYHEFQRHTGMPIGRYVEHLRLNEATKLLRSTTMSAKDIAAQCGFSDMRHFCRALKRVKGKAPRAYRASLPPS